MEISAMQEDNKK